MEVELCYTSSNSNQVPTVVDWGKNNLICFGCCNSVLIYDINDGSGGKVTNSLMKHTKRVNSVKWITGKDVNFEKEIVSGSVDGKVCVWTLSDNIYKPLVLEGHVFNVTIVDGLYKENNYTGTVVVSIAMDCTAKVWYREQFTDNFILSQTLEFGSHIGTSAKLTYIPNSDEIILACSLDDSKIYIYTENNDENLQFEKSAQLVGHEDWVPGLDFTAEGNDLLLASCSQDAFIRLWRITSTSLGSQIIEKTQLKTQNQTYNIYSESVLSGHEGWVYSVKWSDNGKQLLSASIDKSMIIWEYDDTSELWLEKVRVGEIGGNTLGFYGGLFGPNNNVVLGYSYHGAFHVWKYSDKLNEWTPCVTIGGHFGEVVDCAWEPKGQFLYSLGSDQTTRIHASWKSDNKKATWHEIARPQVHGYDMNSIAVISRYHFASAAEEKVIRIFHAPANFVENFRRICKIDSDEAGDAVLQSTQVGPKGASVPSLGLSNKAVYSDDNVEQSKPVNKKNPYPEESQFTATELNEPPTEETLLQNTLWPETQKLYGHGYEVYSLAASPDGKFLASACKSTKTEHATILLWNTSNWQLMQKLVSHSLTVVQLRFSPNCKHLLSVSRDRRWSLFTDNGNGQFELEATTDKTNAVHSRIIWTCAWSHDSLYFVTGSRDGKLVVWSLNKNIERNGSIGKCGLASDPYIFPNSSITAVDFAPSLINDKYLLAVSFETGLIELFQWSTQQWNRVSVFSERLHHQLTVKRLTFRPVFGETGENENKNVLQLASCSSDYSVKIFNINII